MTIESQKRRQIVNGTGGLGPYPFTDIPLYDPEEDLVVRIELSDGTLTDPFEVDIDYTLVYSDETLAGNVTFTSRNVETNEKVVMVRETEITQTIKLSKSGTIDTTNYEDMVDKTTLQNIDQQDELDRSLRVSTAQIGEFNAEIRAVTSADAGRAIVVNDDGNGYDISTTNVNDIDDAVEDAQNAALSAQASASSAASSAASASVSENNAAQSAQDAADSAASVELPNPAVANTYLKRNSGNSEYESQTVTDVANDLESPLGVDTLKSQVVTGYLHVREEQPNGTNGGTSVAGVQTRVLNTVKTNSITGASLSSNQVTLPAGKYNFYAIAPCFRVDAARLNIYNVTDTSVLALGQQSFSNDAGIYSTVDTQVLAREIILTVTTVIELQQYTQIAQASQGLGVSVPDGLNEVFSELIIEKIGE